MIDAGSSYAQASSELIVAIMALRKEAGLESKPSS
jgi:hypothetical protein